MADISLLDQSVADLVLAAADLPLADLQALKAAEEVGKTRKSAIRSLDELIAARMTLEAMEPAIEEPEGGEVLEDLEPLDPTVTWTNPNVITNCMANATLHLGDGRRLAHGESAQVEPELADFLRERGQAE